MASATSSRPRKSADLRPLPPARTLAAPLRALALSRKAAPLLYFEFGAPQTGAASCDGTTPTSHERAVTKALARSVGSLLRRKDRVVAGPGGRWFAALLLDRAVKASARAAVSDADLGIVAGRLAASIRAHVDASNLDEARQAHRARTPAVRAGWTIIEPRDAERPLAELRHALRGAAVVARVEERRGTVLAAVTHELRTPLTSILGFSEHLRTQSGSNAARARAVGIIEEEARRLRRLVDGLIDMGALQAGRLQLRRRRSALTPIARKAVRLIMAAAQEKGVRVTIRGGARSYVDGDRLLQILVNVLDNAVRHARRDGSVGVVIEHRGDAATIAISDDGAGFDPQLGRRLGTPFGIGVDGHVGLGLSIAGMLCAAHEGDISFGRSRSGGARVVVSLPG